MKIEDFNSTTLTGPNKPDESMRGAAHEAEKLIRENFPQPNTPASDALGPDTVWDGRDIPMRRPTK